MQQTTETRKAIVRDGFRCQWCLSRGRLTPSREGHHIWGRARVDEADGIICLCRSCHICHHDGHSPTREELLEIMPEARKYETLAYGVSKT